ncbi:MAG: type II toxin-antitoxin system Phd/YefM family antitoxin, partial [Gemmatimonas sp.]|nr:type II toxin-antitoxin system Phd/YefM family antitoxin [Gemmatimonas sp.]
MRVYTYTEARQSFAALLEQARREGAVRIRRRDGQTFVVTPEQTAGSPL